MEEIQEMITSGKKYVIKNKNGIKISIRYNNKDQDGSTKWILIVDGDPIYVSDLKLTIPIYTQSIEIKDVGLKHHLSGYAKKVKFKENVAYIS